MGGNYLEFEKALSGYTDRKMAALPNVRLEQVLTWTEKQAHEESKKPAVRLTCWTLRSTTQGSIHYILLQAYLQNGQLDIRDRPLVGAFEGRTPRLKASIPYHLATYTGLKDISDTQRKALMEPALNAMTSEEAAMFMIFRLCIQLEAVVTSHCGKSLPAIMSETTLTKVGDVGLLIDLRKAIPGEIFWRSSTTIGKEGPVQWRDCFVGQGYRVACRAYSLMRVYYLAIKSQKDSWYTLPVAAPQDLIQQVVEILKSGSLPTAEPYRQYILRCLQNHLHHGLTALRGVDLVKGDAIFCRFDTSVLPLLSKRGLPIATVAQSIVDSFLTEVPTDATIYQRLARL